MRRFVLRLVTSTLIVAAITIGLCEVVSFFALRFLEPPSALAIFEDVLVSGGRVTAVKANLNQRFRTADFDTAMRTNSNGYREDFDFNLADVEIAFLGDSVTFGHGVDTQERFTNLLAGRLKEKIDPKRVVSLAGNDGFQPEHYEYFLRKHPELKPKYIVVGLGIGNDLEPDVRETRFDRDSVTLDLPYRAVDAGVNITAAPYRVPFFRALIRYSRTARLTAILVNRSVYRPYLFDAKAVLPSNLNSESLEFGKFNEFSDRAFKSLVAIRDLAGERGGRLLVYVMPQNFYAGQVVRPHLARDLWPKIPDIIATGGLRAAVMGHCSTLGLTCIDAGSVMTTEDFFPTDPHWNRKGHQKAADLLYKYFLENERL